MADHPTAELQVTAYSRNSNIVRQLVGDGNIGTGRNAVNFDADNNLVWSWKNFGCPTVTNLLVVE